MAWARLNLGAKLHESPEAPQPAHTPGTSATRHHTTPRSENSPRWFFLMVFFLDTKEDQTLNTRKSKVRPMAWVELSPSEHVRRGLTWTQPSSPGQTGRPDRASLGPLTSWKTEIFVLVFTFFSLTWFDKCQDISGKCSFYLHIQIYHKEEREGMSLCMSFETNAFVGL